MFVGLTLDRVVEIYNENSQSMCEISDSVIRMAKKPKKTPEEKAAAKVAKSRLFKRAREEWVT